MLANTTNFTLSGMAGTNTSILTGASFVVFLAGMLVTAIAVVVALVWN